jgi:uncharacterized membrane protein YfcA
MLIVAAGLLVGFVVGLTGMGGGALMTPILVLGFGVQPLAAVSSDLVAAFVMKPVGGFVHIRRGTVDRRLVRWLVTTSAPCAFLGALLIHVMGNGAAVQSAVKVALGIALLTSAGSMLVKSVLIVRAETRDQFSVLHRTPMRVRPVATMMIGALGGLVVGVTSVGSGSLIIVLLMLLYPGLPAKALVGTDLVQAVPLVGAAALGHLLYGDVHFGLTGSLLLGCLPGVYLGARLSSRNTSGTLVRRVMVFVLTGSGLKLLGVPNLVLLIVLFVLAAIAIPVWVRMQRVIARWRAEARPD